MNGDPCTTPPVWAFAVSRRAQRYTPTTCTWNDVSRGNGRPGPVHASLADQRVRGQWVAGRRCAGTGQAHRPGQRPLGQQHGYGNKTVMARTPTTDKTRCYRPFIIGKRGAAAANHPLAAQAGLMVVRDGGNAVDAAVGTAMALAVVEPMMSGLGGDGFYHVLDAKTRKSAAFNGTGPAPRAASPDRYGTGIPRRGPRSQCSERWPGWPACTATTAASPGRACVMRRCAWPAMVSVPPRITGTSAPRTSPSWKPTSAVRRCSFEVAGRLAWGRLSPSLILLAAWRRSPGAERRRCTGGPGRLAGQGPEGVWHADHGSGPGGVRGGGARTIRDRLPRFANPGGAAQFDRVCPARRTENPRKLRHYADGAGFSRSSECNGRAKKLAFADSEGWGSDPRTAEAPFGELLSPELLCPVGGADRHEPRSPHRSGPTGPAPARAGETTSSAPPTTTATPFPASRASIVSGGRA